MNSYSRTSNRSPGGAFEPVDSYEGVEMEGQERPASRARTPGGTAHPSRPNSAGSAVGAPLSWRIESSFAANFLDEPAEQIPAHNTGTVSFLIRRGRAEEAPVSGVQTVATPGAIGKVLLRTRDKREVFLLWEMAETDGQPWYGLRLAENNVTKNENPIKILKRVPNLEYDIRNIDPWVLFGQVPEEDPAVLAEKPPVILPGTLKCFYCQAESPGPYGTVAEWHFDPATLARLCETCKFGLLSFLLNRDSHIKILNVQIERLNTEKKGLEYRMENNRDNALVSTLRKRVHNMLKENEELKSNVDAVVARETERVVNDLKTSHSSQTTQLTSQVAQLSAQLATQQKEIDDLRQENRYHAENARVEAERAMKDLAEENRRMREREAEVERALRLLGGVLSGGTQGVIGAGSLLPSNSTTQSPISLYPSHIAPAADRDPLVSPMGLRAPGSLVSPQPETDTDNESMRSKSTKTTNGIGAVGGGKRKTAAQLVAEREAAASDGGAAPRAGRAGGNRPKSGVY
ncbi:hypothetical protein HDU93_006904 [Gonapodya sp. JEL0774]|nr:hypothetical protein HDU93_006904 [Gonapodya sp. JEL0774]